MTNRPFRFLALALGGWICIRAALLAPGWQPMAPPARASPTAALRPPTPARLATVAAAIPARAEPGPRRGGHHVSGRAAFPARPATALAFPIGPPAFASSVAPAATAAHAVPAFGRQAATARRWSASAWALIRSEPGGAALAPGGTLGGSQAGVRILYRIGEGLALSGRAYAPLRRPRASEVAAGLNWRPIAALAVDILAERRQALGREGRSAFSLTIYGGAERALAGRIRLQAYAQAGIVGLRSRDAFVDGAARVAAPIGPVEVGGALWGAAQPGASRLDAGPTLSWRLPVRAANLRVAADWRFRIAGDAAPGSGPALTLAADF